MPPPDQPDETLYARTKRGDLAAFDTLYARYEGRLFAFLVSLLGHRADAEDAFHETFMRTLSSREVVFDRASFRTWLYRIGRNVALNQLRARRQQSAAQDEPAASTLAAPDPAPSPDQALEQRETAAALQEALGRLPQHLCEVFHLRSSGLSYEEMAEVLEIPTGTLKSRMNLMVTRLKHEMMRR
jgi:RNA polymerase sigma-70 factor (ECF subfamily)